MMDTTTFGEFIRQRRLELGLSQDELAGRIGLNVRQADVSRMENDRITLPRRQRLEALAQALEIPIGDLLIHSDWSRAEDAPAVGEVSDRRPMAVPSIEDIADMMQEARVQLATLSSLLARLTSDLQRTALAAADGGMMEVAGQPGTRTPLPARGQRGGRSGGAPVVLGKTQTAG